MDKSVMVLWGFIFFREFWYYLERKRLVEAIIAKDYTELKSWESTKIKVPQKALAKKDKIYI